MAPLHAYIVACGQANDTHSIHRRNADRVFIRHVKDRTHKNGVPFSSYIILHLLLLCDN